MNAVRKGDLDLWRAVGAPFVPRLDDMQVELHGATGDKSVDTQKYLFVPMYSTFVPYPKYLYLYES